MSDVSYRRNLPHIHLDGCPLFITFRLADTLPANIISDLKAQREQQTQASMDAQSEIKEQNFIHYDEWLDKCTSGPRWPENEEVVLTVNKKILEMSNNRYRLFAYCIMSNHVHLLIENLVRETAVHQGKSSNYPITETLRLLKGSTARYCNQILGRSGQFWHHESYDHIVRSEKELEKTIRYIINNPVKAGLVQNWKDWKYSYVNPELGEW